MFIRGSFWRNATEQFYACKIVVDTALNIVFLGYHDIRLMSLGEFTSYTTLPYISSFWRFWVWLASTNLLPSERTAVVSTDLNADYLNGHATRSRRCQLFVGVVVVVIIWSLWSTAWQSDPKSPPTHEWSVTWSVSHLTIVLSACNRWPEASRRYDDRCHGYRPAPYWLR